MFGGGHFYFVAGAVENVPRDFGAVFVGDGDVDEADGLVVGAAAGSGDSGNAEPVVGVEGDAGAGCHGAGDGFADGAVLEEHVVGDGEQGFFGLVAVGDDAAGEVSARAGYVGDAVCEQPAGTGFGGGEGGPEFL